MKTKESRSKSGMHLLGKIKPTMKFAVWVYSSFVVLLSIALLLFFNLYDHDTTLGATRGNELQSESGTAKNSNLTYENLSGNPVQAMPSDEHLASDNTKEAKAGNEVSSQPTTQVKTELNSPNEATEEVSNFNIVPDENQVYLSWTAVSESKDGFSIERSTDGEHFEEIPGSDVTEAANGPDASDYSAIDKITDHKIIYYRLKHSHLDGHVSYSASKKISSESTTTHGLTDLEIVSAGPNPFDQKISVSFNQQVAFEVDFELINTSGVAVYIDVINAHEGLNHYDFIDQAGLPKGTYFLTLLYNHKKQVRKIIKN